MYRFLRGGGGAKKKNLVKTKKIKCNFREADPPTKKIYEKRNMGPHMVKYRKQLHHCSANLPIKEIFFEVTIVSINAQSINLKL